MNALKTSVGMVGSLWFAAVLLMLWAVAMACATVFESQHGTERALLTFYKSWWFELLLGLLAANMLASLVARFPFTPRQIGFVLTHAGILLTLGGALVTGGFGVEGQIGVAEGQTAEHFTTPEDELVLTDRRDGDRSSIELTDAAFDGFTAVDRPRAPVLEAGDVRVQIERFLPDSVWSRRVLDGGPAIVRTEYHGSTFDIPLDECTDQEAPIGDTGYRVRVLRYLPHAVVGQDNEISSASNRPVNPAIEAEIIGPEGREKRLAFARFPDFQSMHGKKQIEGLKLTFVRPDADWTADPVEPVREARLPAVRVRISGGDENHEVWVQKFRPRRVTIGGKPYLLTYERKRVPLGFGLTLDRFEMPLYPGEQQPRSFESHVTITDPATGESQRRVISMNHPVTYAGYSLYQSRYSMSGEVTTSFLSVSRDPGQLPVFAGYILTMLGMVIVLGTRLRDRRRVARHRASGSQA